MRVILIICSAHNLFPFEVDLFEQTELFLLYGAWLTEELLPSFLILGFLLGIAYACNLTLGLKRHQLTTALIVIICLGHIVVAFFLG